MILGINISHHPSICFYQNGKITNFYNEERFLFNKDWIPTSNNFKVFKSILEKVKEKPKFVCYSSYNRFEPFVDEDYRIIQILQNQLNNPNYFFDEKKHHLYHACAGFYFSPFRDAVAVIVDGGGSCNYKIPFRETESIYYINKKTLYPIYKHSSNKANQDFPTKEFEMITNFSDGFENKFSQNSIGGWVFVEGCKKVGFKEQHAGKLMGLASYGYCKEKYNLNYDHVKIAKDAQEKTFNETCLLIDKAKKFSNNIILSGGYFLNCSNNFKYVKKYPNLNFFIDPIPHDGGTAIGVCYYYEHYHK